jgi:oligosaccharide repeat unit polymerase
MDVFGKGLALVFSLMILGQAYLVRRAVGTWLFPACLFGLFWFGYTFVPLAILFLVPASPYAVGFLFLCTLAFSMGSLFFDWKTAFARNGQKRETAPLVYGSPFLKVVFYLSTLASIVFLILDLFDQGFSLHELFFDLQASAATYANLLYSEDLTINIFARLGIVWTFLGAILGGFLFPCTSKKAERWFIAVLSFLPSILVAFTQTGKGLMFFSIAFFYAGLLVYRVSVGKLRLFERGSCKLLVPGTAILIVIVTIAFLWRSLSEIEDRDELINRLISYFASYSCGHLYAFSDWFAFTIGRHSEFSYSRESATHGFYTFMSLFQFLGSHKVVPQGIFDDYYTYGDLLTGNIYTMFRGLILDFGFAGSVLFMFLTSVLLHKTFHVMLLKRRPVFTVAMFVFAVGYFYNSFVISTLSWNRTYVAFVLLWIILQINKLITERGHRRLAHI